MIGGSSAAGSLPVRRPAAVAGVPTATGRGDVMMSASGLVLPRQLPFEWWLGIGRQLSAVSTSAAWCLGDWLRFGENAYPGRYRQAIEHTSLDYQTLRNYAWVAGRFTMSRRQDTLSFGHHAEVAALPEPEQDHWLRQAKEHQWPVTQLRRRVRASLADRTEIPQPPGHQATPDTSPRPRSPQQPVSSRPAPATAHWRYFDARTG